MSPGGLKAIGGVARDRPDESLGAHNAISGSKLNAPSNFDEALSESSWKVVRACSPVKLSRCDNLFRRRQTAGFGREARERLPVETIPQDAVRISLLRLAFVFGDFEALSSQLGRLLALVRMN